MNIQSKINEKIVEDIRQHLTYPVGPESFLLENVMLNIWYYDNVQDAVSTYIGLTLPQWLFSA